jgi:solute carrier family 25 protein 42
MDAGPQGVESRRNDTDLEDLYKTPDDRAKVITAREKSPLASDVVACKDKTASPETEKDMKMEFVCTMEQLRSYNPNFQLTLEVVAILRHFFQGLDPTNEGVISISVLVEKIRQLDPTESYITEDEIERLTCENKWRHQLKSSTEGSDRITFEEFCSLVMMWKEISPAGIQMMYKSWVKEMSAVEFGLANDTDGVFRMSHSHKNGTILRYSPPRPAHLPQKDTVTVPSTPKSAVANAKTVVEKDSKHTVSKSFVVGGISGMIAKSFLAPIDRVKLLFQVSENMQFSIRNAMTLGADIVHRDGNVFVHK